MENKLTKKEISHVFAMYFGLPESIRHVGWRDNIPSMESFIPNDKFILEWWLLLTPLSKITDEDAMGLMHIEYGGYSVNSEVLKIQRSNKGRVEINFRYKHPYHNNDDGYSYSAWATNGNIANIQAFQYLIQKGYAVPLFFSLNHWANGKTAIELGIAVEK